MSTKTKVAIALVLSLLITALGWQFVGRGDVETSHALPARGVVTPSAPPLDKPAGKESVALPPPVDFTQVDRDLDLHGIVVRKADGTPIAGAELQVATYPWRRASVLNHDGYYESTGGERYVSKP